MLNLAVRKVTARPEDVKLDVSLVLFSVRLAIRVCPASFVCRYVVADVQLLSHLLSEDGYKEWSKHVGVASLLKPVQ
jgi:hypothetical protein